jgi:Protein of unknown function (DUF5672)
MSIKDDMLLLQTVYKQIDQRESQKTPHPTEPEALNIFRTELEPHVFSILNRRYGMEFQRYWDSCNIPRDRNKTIVIVERRCHVNLRFCLQNAAYYARGWGISVVCSDLNYAYVNACIGSKAGSVKVIPYFKGIGKSVEDGKTEYNTLLQQEQFWNLFTEEHLLMMETDTYFTKSLPDSILKYDYVASKLPWAPHLPGTGGISYRKRDMMKHLCSLGLQVNKAQDCFVNDAITLVGKKYSYPTLEESIIYFGEFYVHKDMCATHQWWTTFFATPVDIQEKWLTCDI